MPIAKDHVWTLDEVWALPDDSRHRYELVDGELLVSPSPRPLHQRAVHELQLAMGPYARDVGICELLSAPGDVVIPVGQLVQPDVYVIRRLSQDELRADPQALPLPLLAIEVLSPSTARADRLIKRRLYQRAGIELWIVDLDARLVERWTPESDRPEICAEWIEWRPSAASAMLRLDVEVLMRRILDDSDVATPRRRSMSKNKHMWSANEVLALNEYCATRLEVIDGELLRPEGAPPGWEAALQGLIAELHAMGSVSTQQWDR